MQRFPTVRPVSPYKIPPGDGFDQARYVLRDPAELSEDQLLVTLPALYLIELADGSRSRKQIADEFARLTGLEMPEDLFDQLLERLDRSYLLDNERARARLDAISPRPYRLSGSAYPQDRAELRVFLDDLIGAEDPADSPPLRASILPHIDFFRGRDAYRAGYRHFIQGLGRGPLTVVVLGISHAHSRTPFILTRKDFATPMGVVRTDQQLVSRLAQDLPFDPFLDEYNHMTEHSIEFHAVLLRHLAGPERELSIVAVLCGSFQEALRMRFSPRELPGVREFLAALHALKNDRPDLHFLASVDLAHMGLNFDQAPMDAQQLQELARQDAATLEQVERGDAEGFFATLQADRGIRNYCGTPAIYSLLDLFPQPFRLQRYQQCNESDLSSTVTVCAAVL
jgi:AmmeMemoRadiSam system protein B